MGLIGIGSSSESLMLRLETVVADLDEASVTADQKVFESHEKLVKAGKEKIEAKEEVIRDDRGDLIEFQQSGPVDLDARFLQGTFFKSEMSMRTAEIEKKEAAVEGLEATRAASAEKMSDRIDAMSGKLQAATSNQESLQNLSDDIQRTKNQTTRV